MVTLKALTPIRTHTFAMPTVRYANRLAAQVRSHFVALNASAPARRNAFLMCATLLRALGTTEFPRL